MTPDERRFRELMAHFGWHFYGGEGGADDRPSLLGALKAFMGAVAGEWLKPSTASYSYKYTDVIAAVGSAALGWALIYLLIDNGLITYGCSPRHAWLDGDGPWLRDFVVARSVEELVRIVDLEDEA